MPLTATKSATASCHYHSLRFSSCSLRPPKRSTATSRRSRVAWRPSTRRWRTSKRYSMEGLEGVSTSKRKVIYDVLVSDDGCRSDGSLPAATRENQIETNNTSFPRLPAIFSIWCESCVQEPTSAPLLFGPPVDRQAVPLTCRDVVVTRNFSHSS